jgi:ABC-type branched-subunit amino acid transport system substrate-binding protein
MVNDTSELAYRLRYEYPDAEEDEPYSLLSYDTVWALAHAMDEALRNGALLDSADFGTQLIAALHTMPSFEGATGKVKFDQNMDRVGGYDVSSLRLILTSSSPHPHNPNLILIILT